MKYSVMFFLLSLISTTSFAEIYKWVDEHGKVHYGDAPAGQSSTQINIAQPDAEKSLPNSDAVNRDERRRRLAEAMEEDRLQKQEQKQKAREQKETLNKKCVYARDTLKQYEAAGNLYDLDKDGNRIFMSEEEKQSTIDNLRAQIKQHCGN